MRTLPKGYLMVNHRVFRVIKFKLQYTSLSNKYMVLHIHNTYIINNTLIYIIFIIYVDITSVLHAYISCLYFALWEPLS